MTQKNDPKMTFFGAKKLPPLCLGYVVVELESYSGLGCANQYIPPSAIGLSLITLDRAIEKPGCESVWNFMS